MKKPNKMISVKESTHTWLKRELLELQFKQNDSFLTMDDLINKLKKEATNV